MSWLTIDEWVAKQTHTMKLGSTVQYHHPLPESWWMPDYMWTSTSRANWQKIWVTKVEDG